MPTLVLSSCTPVFLARLAGKARRLSDELSRLNGNGDDAGGVLPDAEFAQRAIPRSAS